MGEAARRRITIDEFLVWDDGTDRRYELVAGEIVAMSPPSSFHGAIAVRAGTAISGKLKPPCQAISEAGIILPWRNDTYYQADLAITCAPLRQGEWGVPQPLLIIEVLSPSTMAHDRSVKLVDYRHIDSVREIVLISSDEKRVELWRRGDAAWAVFDLEASDRLQLESIGFDIAIEALYDGLDFTAGDAVSGSAH